MDDTEVQQSDDTSGFSAPDWEDVQDSFKKAFPDLNPDEMKGRYQQIQKMAQVRQQVEQSPPTALQRLGSSAIPFNSLAATSEYQKAKDRLAAGNPYEGDSWSDYHTIANYEKSAKQNAEEEKGFGGYLAHGLAKIPAIVGESLAIPLPGIGGVPGRIAGQVLKTPLMPSLYAETAASRAMDQGGSIYDPKNLVPSMGMAAVQNVVFGSMGNLTKGIANPAARFVAGVGVGGAELQAAQVLAGAVDKVLPEAYRTNTQFGYLGKAIRGEWGDLAKEAVTDGITLAAFQFLHGNPYEARRTLDDLKDHFNPDTRQGLSYTPDDLPPGTQDTETKQTNTDTKEKENTQQQQQEQKRRRRYTPDDSAREFTATLYAKARDILGLPPEFANLGPQEQQAALRKAFRDTSKRVHPDRGGTDYDMKMANWANDYLAGKTREAPGFKRPPEPPEPPKQAQEAPKAAKPTSAPPQAPTEPVEAPGAALTPEETGQLPGQKSTHPMGAEPIHEDAVQGVPEPAEPVQEDRPAQPFATISDSDVAKIAKQLGLSAKGSREDVIGRIIKVPMGQQILETAEKSAAPTQQPQKPATYAPTVEQTQEPEAAQPTAKPSGVERLRQAQKGQTKAQAQPGFVGDELADQFWHSEEGLNLQQLMEAKGLSDVEKRVLSGRLDPVEAKALEEIGKTEINPKTGKPYSGREWASGIEKKALKKLGLPEGISIADIIHEQNKLGFLEKKLAAGEVVTVTDLGHDPEEVRSQVQDEKDKYEKTADDLDELTNKILRAKTNGKLTPARIAEFERDAAKIRAKHGVGPSEPSKYARKAAKSGKGKASVRRADAGGISENAAQPADENAGQPAPENAQGAPASTEPEAASNVVGIPPKTQEMLNELVQDGERVVIEDLVKEILPKHFDLDEIHRAMDIAGPFPKGVTGKVGKSKMKGQHRFWEAEYRKSEMEKKVVKQLNDFKEQQRHETGDASFDVHEFDPIPPSANPAPHPFTLGGIVHNFMADEGGHLNVDDVVRVAKQVYNYGTELFDRFSSVVAPRTSRLSPYAGDALARWAASETFGKAMTPIIAESVLGKNYTPADIQLYGQMITEWRLRYIRKVHTDLGNQATNPAVKNQHFQKARDVSTTIGDPDKPMKTLADYVRTVQSPQGQEFLKKWRDNMVPLMEKNFRMAQGLDETDPINSITQVPGIPINLLAINPKNPKQTVGASRQGRLRNAKITKYGPSHEAEGNADAYDTNLLHIIENSLVKGGERAAKAEFFRTAAGMGVGKWIRPGEQIPGFTELGFQYPPAGTQATGPGQTSMAFRDEMVNEVRQAGQIDRKPYVPLWTPFAHWVASTSVLGTLEGSWHTGNNLSQLVKADLGHVPGYGIYRTAVNAYNILAGTHPTGKDNPAHMKARKDLAELARIDAQKASHDYSNRTWNPVEYAKGFFNEEGPHFEPFTWSGRFLNLVNDTMRLTMKDTFERLAKRQGRLQDTEQNMRNFTNALGNYNKRTQNGLVAFGRDIGGAEFGTAGTNFLSEGLRATVGSVNATATTNWQALGLRAEYLGRMIALLVAGNIYNYLKWGRLDGDDNIPWWGIKVGEGPGGRNYYILGPGTLMSPMVRGMRSVGLLAAVEGRRQNQPAGKQFDHAIDSQINAFLHPFFGPAAQIVHEAATGKDALGRQIAETAKPNESQKAKNLEATIKNLNPTLATAFGWDAEPTKRKKEGWERFSAMFGPFGVKTAEPRKKR